MKPVIGVVLAVCYLAALAGIVRHEGAAYRRELRRRRQRAVAHVVVTPPAIGERKPEPAADPPPIPPQAPRDDHDVDTPAPPAKEIAARPRPSRVVQSAVDPGPTDLRRPAPDEGRNLAADSSRPIAADRPLRDDPVAIRRLDAILANLAASRSPPREPIRFRILDSADIDAFSEIGGHISISRGVFDLCQTGAELEFVVAHELAHTELGHTAARREPLGAEQEFAADTWAYQALRRAGRSHRQSVLFLRRYAAYTETHGPAAGSRAPRAGPQDSRQDIENHYPAYPLAAERLKRLEALDAPVKKSSR